MGDDNSTKNIIEWIDKNLSPNAQKGIEELLLSENLCIDKKALGTLLRSFCGPAGLLQLPKYNEPENFVLLRSGIDRLRSQYYQYIFDTTEGKQLRSSLHEDARLNALKGKMLNTGNGGVSVSRKCFVMWYMWAQNEYGNEKAQELWDSYFETGDITVTHALWVLGVKVDETISLTENVSLTPVKSVPESSTTESFRRYIFDSGNIHLSINKPECAITMQTSTPKLWENSRLNNSVLSNDAQLEDLSLLLNLVPKISCIPYFSTSYISSETPPGLFINGESGSGRIHDVIGDTSHKLTVDMLDGFSELIIAFSKLDLKEKIKFEHAVSRLSLAKRRKKIEDKILDLTIALEMVLLSGIKEQLGFTFRLRGSWLIGSDSATRKEIHDTLKNLYEYRSSVAHTGILEKNDPAKIKAIKKQFPEYIALAEAIIKKLIIGGTPDWNALLLGSK
jgi:hypothetical protein